MELIIILLPVVLIMIGIEEIKYKLKIRRDAIYYRDLNRINGTKRKRINTKRKRRNATT